jgi:hypothetical protein
MIWCSWCCSGTESRGYELKIKREIPIKEMKKKHLRCECCEDFDEYEIYMEVEEIE